MSKNIAKVNRLYMKKYAAIAVVVGALNAGKKVVFGSARSSTNDHQKSQSEVTAIVPNVLPFWNPIMPTITSANLP
jgi:hypothetical protein